MWNKDIVTQMDNDDTMADSPVDSWVPLCSYFDPMDVQSNQVATDESLLLACQPERYLGKKREGSLIIDDHAAAQRLPRAVVGLSIWPAVEVSETHSVSPWGGTSQKLWHQ